MRTAAQRLDAPKTAVASLDEDGFLIDPEDWSDSWAMHMAEQEGLAPLGERHWRVIKHIRERYFRVGGVPVMRLVCRATGLDKTEIHSLFGGCLAIWRIAGLSNPGEEARAHF